MSGFSDQPDKSSNIYNSANKSNGFVKITDPRLGLITDITPGEATQAKALVIDESNDITQFRNIGFTGSLTLSTVSLTQDDLASLYNLMYNVYPGYAYPTSFVTTDSDNCINNLRCLFGGAIRLTNTLPTYSTGAALELSYANDINRGNIYAYNRTTNQYQSLNMQDSIYINPSRSVCIAPDTTANFQSTFNVISNGNHICLMDYSNNANKAYIGVDNNGSLGIRTINKPILIGNDFLINSDDRIFIGDAIDMSFTPEYGKTNIQSSIGPQISLFNNEGAGSSCYMTIEDGGSFVINTRYGPDTSIFLFKANSGFVAGDIIGNAIMSNYEITDFSGRGAFMHFKDDIARFEGYDYDASLQLEMALGRNDAIRIKPDGKVLIGSTTLNSGKVNITSSTANHLFMFNSSVDNSYTRLTCGTDGTLTMANHSNATTLESNNVWTPSGNYSCGLNVVSEYAGVHAYGINNTYLTTKGPGAHMGYSAGYASFYGYNYTTNAWTDMFMGNYRIVIKGSNGYVGIGTTNPLYPFHVAAGTTTKTTSSSFGYVDNGGAGSGTGFTNRPFGACFQSNVLIDAGSELNVLSDIRLKRAISSIDDAALDRFISCEPIEYQFKSQADDDLKKHYGYRAQDLVAQKLDYLLGIARSDEVLEEVDISCYNGDTFHLDSDKRLTVNLQNMIPLLHRAIQKQQIQIQKNEQVIAELLSRLT